MRSKWIRWTLAIVAILGICFAASVGMDQLRGRSIVSKAGLPPLPSKAWITYAHIDGHDLLFEEVAMGFSAPPAELSEWLEAVAHSGTNRSGSGASILNHSVRKWGVTSGADFSATLSYK